jgi:hypothetical protein
MIGSAPASSRLCGCGKIVWRFKAGVTRPLVSLTPREERVLRMRFGIGKKRYA